MKLSAKAQASINKVIEKFQTGDLSAVTRIARIQVASDAPVNKWSLSNKVLAFLQSDELDCRGYKQWQKEGRTVKKGSKAVYILRPKLAKIDHENEEETKIFVLVLLLFQYLQLHVLKVTLASWKPNQIISDLVKLFDLFYADVKALGFITSP